MPTCLNAVISAALLSLLIGVGSAAAQQRSEGFSSQRMLPLPDGKLRNAETQMQLLQRLRSLLAVSDDAEKSEASPRNTSEIDDEQLEQLQQALKKLGEQLPPGIKAPDLDLIPKEQLDEAISSPAVQQQLKKMLEQFSRDGLLPKSAGQNEKNAMPPLPRQRMESSTRPESKQKSQPIVESSPPHAEKSWQSLKDSMKKLAQADGEADTEESRQRSFQVFQDVLERYRNSLRDNPSSAAANDSGLDTPEFLRDQLRDGFPIPNADHSEESEHGSTPSASNDRQNSDPQNSAQQGQSSRLNPRGSALDSNPPGIDIRRELDRRGIRGTIEKLVEKARKESNAQQRARLESLAGRPQTGQAEHPSAQSGSGTVPDIQPNDSGDAGLQKSLKNLPGGLDDNVQDIVEDANFRDRASEWRREPESARQTAPPDSESGLNKWTDAASDLLSELSKPPQAPASKQSPSAGTPAVSADNPLAIESFFLAGIGLLGMIAVLVFCMRRPLLKLVSDATGINIPKRFRQLEQIRSRKDVIAAFHELALSPEQMVESWWTHQAAARKLAEESPQQGNAVRTLAEIYEQARYLPEDVELPADRIQSARNALAECR